MSRRVKPVQDQKMKRRRAVIVGSSADNGQSRAVLERPQGVDQSDSICPRPGDLEFLSPNPTHNLKRFGDYKLRVDSPLDGWIRDALFG